MTIEFDDNGKFFTDFISKVPVHVIVQTITHRILGIVHVCQDRRLKDELDLPERFIAITEAIICSPDGQVLQRADFLALQRDEIIWVMPDNEFTDSSKEDAE